MQRLARCKCIRYDASIYSVLWYDVTNSTVRYIRLCQMNSSRNDKGSAGRICVHICVYSVGCRSILSGCFISPTARRTAQHAHLASLSTSGTPPEHTEDNWYIKGLMEEESVREHLLVFRLGAVIQVPKSQIGGWTVPQGRPGDQDSWEQRSGLVKRGGGPWRHTRMESLSVWGLRHSWSAELCDAYHTYLLGSSTEQPRQLTQERPGHWQSTSAINVFP